MEDHRGLLGALEQELLQDIGDNRYSDKGQKAHCAENPNGLSRAVLAELVENSCEETHDCKRITTDESEGRNREKCLPQKHPPGYLGRRLDQLSV